jgi:hypothetical protein
MAEGGIESDSSCMRVCAPRGVVRARYILARPDTCANARGAGDVVPRCGGREADQLVEAHVSLGQAPWAQVLPNLQSSSPPPQHPHPHTPQYRLPSPAPPQRTDNSYHYIDRGKPSSTAEMLRQPSIRHRCQGSTPRFQNLDVQSYLLLQSRPSPTPSEKESQTWGQAGGR